MTRWAVLLAAALVLSGCAGDSPAKDDPVEQVLAERFEFPRLGARLREGERRIRGKVASSRLSIPPTGPTT